MRRSFMFSLALITTLCLGCEEGVVSSSGEVSGSESSVALGQSDSPAMRTQVLNFVAPLSGDQEVPAVETRATGVARFKLSKDGESLDYKLNVANIDGITQAHIHCGPAGVNGSVVAFLFGLEAAGVTVNGTLAEGTITASDVIPLSDSPACPGGIADFEELLDKMMAGGTYANVHTLAHPPGEIRGQIDRGSGVSQ